MLTIPGCCDSPCVQVAKPNIGENRPSRVRADITLTLSVRPAVKAEWECMFFKL